MRTVKRLHALVSARLAAIVEPLVIAPERQMAAGVLRARRVEHGLRQGCAMGAREHLRNLNLVLIPELNSKRKVSRSLGGPAGAFLRGL